MCILLAVIEHVFCILYLSTAMILIVFFFIIIVQLTRCNRGGVLVGNNIVALALVAIN